MIRMPLHRRLLAGGALCAMTLSACAPSLPELRTEQQWTDSLRRLGLFAFYPVNEDVMVGDVYLYAPSQAARADDRFAATRLATAPCEPLLRQLTEQGRGRPRIERAMITWSVPGQPAPAQPSGGQGGAAAGGGGGNAAGGTGSPAGNATTRPAPVTRTRAAVVIDTTGAPNTPAARLDCPEAGGDFHIASAASPHRHVVRLMAQDIPTMQVARYSAAQLNAWGLLGNIGAALGLGQAGSAELSVTLRGLQGLTLDAARADTMLRQVVFAEARPSAEGTTHRSRLLTPAQILRALQQSADGDELLRLACTGSWQALEDRQVAIMVMNRVLYASGIEYAFGETNSFAARLGLDLQALLPPATPGGAARQPTVPDAGNTPTLPGVATATAASAEAARLRVEALLKAIAEQQGQLPAGARMSFGVSTSGQLSLRVTYDRPMGVGAGSALSYGLQEAMLPINHSEVADARRTCNWAGHGDTTTLVATLNANLLWVLASGNAEPPIRTTLRVRRDHTVGGRLRTF